MQKMIYAIGLGPGDPELLTIRARQILNQVDVVIVPQSDKTGRSIAKDIVSCYVPEDKLLMYYFPMNNDNKLLNKRYQLLAEKIDEILNDGKTVAYVTIGDLSIYSTFNYLMLKLKEKNIVAIKICGIPSFIAAANKINENLVQKGESFCVIELSEIEKLEQYLNLFNTVVVMKVYKKVKLLTDFVRKSELVERAYLIKRCTLEGEKIYDLKSDTFNEDSGYLSIAILFGKRKKL